MSRFGTHRERGEDRFVGLDGNFYDLRYADDDDTLDVYYRQLGNQRGRPNEDFVWFLPSRTEYGDYGGSLVEITNHNVLEEKAEELSKEYDDWSWWKRVSGSYGSNGLLFHTERTPDEIVDMLDSLQDYPLIDDEKHSELEMEAQNEAWDSWGATDYRKALEEVFDGDADEISDDDLAEHFHTTAESNGIYWVNEQGDQVYIDMKEVANAADEPPAGFVHEGEDEIDLEDAAVLSDSGPLGSRTSASFGGKFIGEFSNEYDAIAALKAKAKRDNWWPDLYYVDDHGGVHARSWD